MFILASKIIQGYWDPQKRGRKLSRVHSMQPHHPKKDNYRMMNKANIRVTHNKLVTTVIKGLLN